MRQDQIIIRESDALHSSLVARRVVPELVPAAKSIALALDTPDASDTMADLLFEGWADTVARICIGLRRLGTGGSLLITSTPIGYMLDITHRFRYRRLGDSTILNALDAEYLSKVEWDESDMSPSASELSCAQGDAEDRANELTGAVQVVTSLAAADGLVLMDSSLVLVGFGVKIRDGGRVKTVYDGPDFVRNGTRAKRIDTSHFGTRHGSMLRYCQTDRNAIGVVVSQDGHTRLIAAAGRRLTLWDDVMLLGYEHDVRIYAQAARNYRLQRSKYVGRLSLGFTSMPKTLRALLSYGNKGK